MAATYSNRGLTQYSGDTPSDLFIRDVPDWTKKQLRTDTPFLKLIGRAPAPDNPMLKSEWGWGHPDPTDGTITEAISATPSTGVITITVDDGDKYGVAEVLLIDDEQFRINSVDTDANTVQAQRAFAGTTAAAHSDNAVIIKLAPALKEREDDPLSPVTQGQVDYNYPQIMVWSWELSERARITKTYESRNFDGDREKQEMRKKMEITAPSALERQLLFGRRAQGSTSSPSAMGGLLLEPSFITTNTQVHASSTDPLTEYLFMTAAQTTWNLVGRENMGKTVMVGPFTKRIINSWYNSTRRSASGDSKISVKWDEIDTDFGTFRFVINYILKDREQLVGFNPDDIKLRPYGSSTGWQTGKLATDGWYTHGFLRGDWTMIAPLPDTRFRLYNYSTTATDYPVLA